MFSIINLEIIVSSMIGFIISVILLGALTVPLVKKYAEDKIEEKNPLSDMDFSGIMENVQEDLTEDDN